MKPQKAPKELKVKIDKVVKNLNDQVKSRGIRIVNVLRNAELEVLSGERHGKVYKKPGTYGKTASKSTKELKKDYNHKLRGGQLYRASAPGESPARRTGALRLKWTGYVRGEQAARRGIEVFAVLESKSPYAGCLEKGTSKMAARPFVEKIKEKAAPEIKKIYKESFVRR